MWPRREDGVRLERRKQAFQVHSELARGGGVRGLAGGGERARWRGDVHEKGIRRALCSKLKEIQGFTRRATEIP